jgi:hypothetical protein
MIAVRPIGRSILRGDGHGAVRPASFYNDFTELRVGILGGAITDIRDLSTVFGSPFKFEIFQISKIDMPISDAEAFARDNDITGFVTLGGSQLGAHHAVLSPRPREVLWGTPSWSRMPIARPAINPAIW